MSLSIQRHSKHIRWAGFLFFADFLLVWISFALGIWFRFHSFSWDKLMDYGIGVAFASIVLPSVLYIGGLYSPRDIPTDKLSHTRWLVLGIIAVLATVLATGSIVFTSRVGRGVLLVSIVILLSAMIVRQWWLMRLRRRRVRTLLCLVACEVDERTAVKLFEFWGDRAKSFSIVLGNGYRAKTGLPVAGAIEDFGRQSGSEPFDIVLVRDSHFQDRDMAAFLRGLRYEGSEILPVSDACEDIYQAVPLEVISDAWLFRASTQSELFYIRKLKRISDIVLALLFLLLLSPFLGLGAVLVRLSSPGPVIFRQKRAGRLGRSLTVLKLRTMHVASSERKSRWADAEGDRIFPLGRFLRAFRVDEIPQLINVLRGEMSFVGPRPEQLEIVEELSAQIPFYRERLLIQPGLTGWAQVNYPYGASVEDAARKLEYDLYYMKHMGIFLDFFILLGTVKIILCGGLREGDDDYLRFREDIESLEEEFADSKKLTPAVSPGHALIR